MNHRWDRPPARLSKKRVRQILVEDAVAGRPTPLQWATQAYLFLGDGEGAKAEREFVSVRQEVGALGATMPHAPGQ